LVEVSIGIEFDVEDVVRVGVSDISRASEVVEEAEIVESEEIVEASVVVSVAVSVVVSVVVSVAAEEVVGITILTFLLRIVMVVGIFSLVARIKAVAEPLRTVVPLYVPRRMVLNPIGFRVWCNSSLVMPKGSPSILTLVAGGCFGKENEKRSIEKVWLKRRVKSSDEETEIERRPLLIISISNDLIF
jgi:hypothetical protein